MKNKERRVSTILLTVLLMLVATLAFVSCKVDMEEDASDLVSIKFIKGKVPAKSLVSSRTFNESDYYWYYTASKVNTNTPSTGATSEQTKIGDADSKGLSDAIVGPFSQGLWNFTLYGYTEKKGTATAVLAYKGTASNESIEKGNGTDGVQSIYVSVEPQKTAEGKGTLVISSSIVLKANGTSYTANTYKVTNNNTGTETQNGTIEEDTDVTIENLTSGAYKVVVSYVANETVGETTNSYTYATNTIVVNIFDGLTTTISGTLDESTMSVKFAPKTNDDGSITQDITIESNTAKLYEFDYSPASATYTSDDDKLGTTVAGIFVKEEDSSSAILTLVTYDETAVNNETKFTVKVGENASAAAGFDLTLTGATISTNEESKIVTVTSYIEKGLGDTYVYMTHLKSDETTETMTKVTSKDDLEDGKFYYDNSTGELVFKTSSFSSFLVTYSSARNITQDKVYSSVVEMFADANAGDSLLLLKDVTVNDNTKEPSENPLLLKSGVTLDLSDHTLTFTGKSTAFATDTSTGSEAMMTLKNGIINGTSLEKSERLIRIDRAGSSFTLSDITITTTGSGILVANSTNDITVNIENSTINVEGEGYYALSTNATTPTSLAVNINVSNSTLSTPNNTAVLFNVNGGINMSDSVVIGALQGMILRGGENHKITNSTIKSYNWDKDNEESWSFYFTKWGSSYATWASGNNAPCATLVAGNKSASYLYNTTVVLENVEFGFTNDTTEGDCASIYVWQNKIGDKTYDVSVTGTVKDNAVSVNKERNDATFSITGATVTEIDY